MLELNIEFTLNTRTKNLFHVNRNYRLAFLRDFRLNLIRNSNPRFYDLTLTWGGEGVEIHYKRGLDFRINRKSLKKDRVKGRSLDKKITFSLIRVSFFKVHLK